MTFYQTFGISACPGGFTALDGDVPGSGLIGYYNASVEKCSGDCNDYQNITIDGIKECSGFEHSESKDSCKLLAQLKPNATKYQDYQFCSHTGE